MNCGHGYCWLGSVIGLILQTPPHLEEILSIEELDVLTMNL